MASILADIGTKVGQELKTLDTRLASAETAIVNLGGQQPPPTGNFTIDPVSWTNLTEINLSGEKLVNVDFSNVSSQYVADPDNDGTNGGTEGASQMSPVDIIVLQPFSLRDPTIIFPVGTHLHGTGLGGANLQRMEDPNDPRNYPYRSDNQNTGNWDWGYISDRGTKWEYAKEQTYPTNWSINNGTIDQTKLSEGIIKGSNGSVGIDQMFSSPLAIGTRIVVKATRADFGTGGIAFKHLKADGNAQGGNISIPIADGFTEYEVVTSDMHGIRFSTNNGTHEISSVSAFQGVVSGGSVQVNGNGGLEKIAGLGGFNAGASSTNFIEGNSNGYAQFQWGSANKSLQIGLTYLDDDYGNVEPFRLVINGNGHVYTNGNNIFSGGTGWASQGDYFRIRHYASDNSVRFQRRQEIFQDDADFCLLSSCGLSPNNGSVTNHTFDADSRPLILAKRDISSVGAVQGQYYKIHIVNTNNQTSRIYDLDENLVGWIGGNPRGLDWEVQESIGQDYVTFHTHSELTNGNNLYVDTSLFHVGSRLNDVLLAR